jgi:hypothetical protein
MATLTSLGWNAKAEHIPAPREHLDRPDVQLLMNAGDTATVFEAKQAWVKSDTLVEVRR